MPSMQNLKKCFGDPSFTPKIFSWIPHGTPLSSNSTSPAYAVPDKKIKGPLISWSVISYNKVGQR